MLIDQTLLHEDRAQLALTTGHLLFLQGSRQLLSRDQAVFYQNFAQTACLHNTPVQPIKSRVEALWHAANNNSGPTSTLSSTR